MPRPKATREDYRQQLLQAQQYLQQRMDQPVDPAALARVAGFSLHHFHRIFRAQMGESVMEHVRRLRLERAARRLRAGDERIIELALEAGLDSHEAFTRAFVARFAVTPSQFRTTPSTRVAEWKATATGPAVPVTVRRYAPQRVAYMRHRGGYAGIEAFWARMRAWVATRGLSEAALYGVCPDDPEVTDEALLRFDACVSVPQDFVADDQVAITILPGGTYAVGLHTGPYHRLSETYLDVIGRWFPTSGMMLAADAVVEHYLNNPEVTPAEQLQTQVRVRVADWLV